MRERHLRVTRSARYFTLGTARASITELWLVTHGYGQLAGEFLRAFTVLDDGSRLIVAPEALNRFYVIPVADTQAADRPVGATWMTRVDREREIEDYVAYLDAVCAEVLRPFAERRVVVRALGFSQGVATIARWVERGGVSVDQLVCWAGLLPPDLDLAALARRLGGSVLRIVVGDSDGIVSDDMIAAQGDRLRAHGIPFEVTRFAGGHRLSRATLKVLAGEPISPSAAPDR